MSLQEFKSLVSKYSEEDYDQLCQLMYSEECDVTIDGKTIKFVDSYRSWPGADPMINVVVEYDGKFYHNSSYYDSWGGDTDWDDYDWAEVEKVQVTKEEWRRVK